MRLLDATLEKVSSGITVRTSFDVKPGSYWSAWWFGMLKDN
jgi:hypothetical protein